MVLNLKKSALLLENNSFVHEVANAELHEGEFSMEDFDIQQIGEY